MSIGTEIDILCPAPDQDSRAEFRMRALLEIEKRVTNDPELLKLGPSG